MAYQRHDVNNNPVTSIESYKRHEIDCTESPVQPQYNTVTDSYGNTYENWNGDYVRHDKDNNPV